MSCILFLQRFILVVQLLEALQQNPSSAYALPLERCQSLLDQITDSIHQHLPARRIAGGNGYEPHIPYPAHGQEQQHQQQQLKQQGHWQQNSQLEQGISGRSPECLKSEHSALHVCRHQQQEQLQQQAVHCQATASGWSGGPRKRHKGGRCFSFGTDEVHEGPELFFDQVYGLNGS